jgi:DNA-binding CsgD family transcriptional regulator
MELSEEIFDCPNFGAAGSRLLAPLGRFINAGSMAMLQYQWSDEKPFAIKSAIHAVDPDYHELYNIHYLRQDPMVERARPANVYFDRCAGGQIEIFALSDISDYRELERTAFYNEFFRPIRVHHVMAVCYRADCAQDRVIGIGFHRSTSAHAFDHADMRKARQIAAPLMTKVCALLLEEDNVRQSHVIDDLSSLAVDRGVLLLDERDILLFANDRARRDLEVRDAVGQSFNADGIPAVAELLSRCRCLPAPFRNADLPEISARLSSGALPIKVSAQALNGAPGKRRYLITTETDGSAGPFARHMLAMGLTRRESDIVGLLVQGLSNPEIGEELRISVRTVENHLRSIYGKAAVQSRMQLIGQMIRRA